MVEKYSRSQLKPTQSVLLGCSLFWKPRRWWKSRRSFLYLLWQISKTVLRLKLARFYLCLIYTSYYFTNQKAQIKLGECASALGSESPGHCIPLEVDGSLGTVLSSQPRKRQTKQNIQRLVLMSKAKARFNVSTDSMYLTVSTWFQHLALRFNSGSSSSKSVRAQFERLTPWRPCKARLMRWLQHFAFATSRLPSQCSR